MNPLEDGAGVCCDSKKQGKSLSVYQLCRRFFYSHYLNKEKKV